MREAQGQISGESGAEGGQPSRGQSLLPNQLGGRRLVWRILSTKRLLPQKGEEERLILTQSPRLRLCPWPLEWTVTLDLPNSSTHSEPGTVPGTWWKAGK